MANDKLNIGLIVSELADSYDSAVCNGAVLGAEYRDVNLFIFPGRYLGTEYHDKERSTFDYQYNTIFDLPTLGDMDGLIVTLGTIGTSLSDDDKMRFLSKYEDIPVVLLGSEIGGYSNVVVDNRSGLRETLEHLITGHKVTKLGFLSGPKTNVDAQERLGVYQDVIREHSLDLDDSYVAYGNFSEYSEEVTLELINRHPDIQAIACANDQMAIGVYKAIESIGKKPGIDIFVTGFDNAPCCTELVPNLTTVSADPSAIGQQAVLDIVNQIEVKMETHSVVPSNMIQRGSCGCNIFTGADLDDETRELLKNTEDHKIVVDILVDALFCRHSKSAPHVVQVKEKVKGFLTDIVDLYDRDELNDYNREMVADRFIDMMEDVRHYISVENVLKSFEIFTEKVFSLHDSTDENKFDIVKLSAGLYRHLRAYNRAEDRRKDRDIDELNNQINRFAQDMLIYDHDDDAIYWTVIDKLSRLHMHSSYLYLYKRPIIHRQDDEWEIPKYYYLKGYHDKDEVYSLAYKDQKVLSSSIFRNDFLPDDRRYTMVISPLYSALEQYGLLISEVDPDYFDFVKPITNQLFSAIKIIHLLKEQAVTQDKLQASLKKIQESNVKLDEAAKVDELTGIYNRRGFSIKANQRIRKPRNQGSKMLAVYADMDNLKFVNDKFGHEEGDYSLKFIADVLKKAFKSKDIVARMGGDEFAVLANIDGEDDIENRLRKRINKIVYDMNKANDKEYYIGISLGFYEFACFKDIDILHIMDTADKRLYEEKKSKVKILYKKDMKDIY